MTSRISRRALVQGGAWAAPVVLASAAIPAYAASPTAACISFKDSVDTAVVAGDGTMTTSEITVPDGVFRVEFSITGGGGGMSHTSAPGGSGATITGVVKVLPGQKLKFYGGSGGIGYGTAPAEGGKGFNNGGSALESAMPDYPTNWTFLGKTYDLTDIFTSHSATVLERYGASGGGSSAVTLVDASGKETVVAIAGGGGGGGYGENIAQVATGSSDNLDAQWNPTNDAPSGGNAGNTAQNGEPVRFTYKNFPAISANVTGGKGAGVRGTVGTAASAAQPSGGIGLNTTTDWEYATQFKLGQGVIGKTSSTVPSASNPGGQGADGAGAWSWSMPYRGTEDLVTADMQADHYRRGRMVGSGGGGGYGGGGSGAAVVTTPHRVNGGFYEGKKSKLAYSSITVASGGGGAGGSYVNTDLLDATQPVTVSTSGNGATAVGVRATATRNTYALCEK